VISAVSSETLFCCPAKEFAVLRFLLVAFALSSGFCSMMTTLSAADRIGEFEVRSLKFTGGEYQAEEFGYLVLPPANVEPERQYPLVLFLHGAGERGNDPQKLLPHFPTQMAKSKWREKFPCYLVVPQCRDGVMWIQAALSDRESSPMPTEPTAQLQMAKAVLDKSLNELPVDRDRVYLTGLSMGGFGSWELAMRHPELFAALAPVCGGGDETQAARLKGLPIRVGHGAEDTVVWPIRSQRMVEAVKKAGGNIQYTEYAGVGHNSWTSFYSEPDGVVAWMFQQKRTR
jgi:predicted peptidase